MAKQFFRSVFFLLPIFLVNFYAFCQSGFIESIYFKPNSFSIDKEYEKALTQIAKQLTSDTFGYLKIFSFTDTQGSKSFNDILSEKRANAVYNYLAAQAKIDTSRVYVAWLGESGDIYDLHFPQAHKQKRCVDIWIQFYRKPK